MPDRNPAVKKAYEDRRYTDARGTVWGRGADGWHDVALIEEEAGQDSFVDGFYLLGHSEFIRIVESENPIPASTPEQRLAAPWA